MPDRFEVIRRQLDKSPLENGKHSTNQKVLRRDSDGFRRVFGNPNSKVEKRKRKGEIKVQDIFEIKEF